MDKPEIEEWSRDKSGRIVRQTWRLHTEYYDSPEEVLAWLHKTEHLSDDHPIRASLLRGVKFTRTDHTEPD